MLILALACGAPPEQAPIEAPDPGNPFAPLEGGPELAPPINASPAPTPQAAAAATPAPAATPAGPIVLELALAEGAMPAASSGLPHAADANVVYITHKPWNGTVFELHIFDPTLAVSATDPGAAALAPDPAAFKWERQGAALTFKANQTQGVQYDLAGKVTTEGRDLFVEGAVTNTGRDAWVHHPGLGWLSLWARRAPDFMDAQGERTFVQRRGSGAEVSIQSLKGSRTPAYDMPLLEPLYQNRMMLKAADGRQAILAVLPAAALGGNRAADTGSIGVQIDLSTPPGGAVEFRAVLRFDPPPAGIAP